jgi:glutathione S-transferase
MLRILGRASSSNVQKVLWCCDELGIPFEREDYGGEFGRTKDAAYLALNPTALVPTIIEDDFVLWESNSIVRYLASRYGNGRLWPVDARAAASASRWMDLQLGSVQKPAGVLFRVYLRGEKFPEADVAAAKQRAIELWTILDSQLARTPYLNGDELSVADIAFGNNIHRWYKFDMDRPALPGLRAWYDRLCGRPAYAKHIASR